MQATVMITQDRDGDEGHPKAVRLNDHLPSYRMDKYRSDGGGVSSETSWREDDHIKAERVEHLLAAFPIWDAICPSCHPCARHSSISETYYSSWRADRWVAYPGGQCAVLKTSRPCTDSGAVMQGQDMHLEQRVDKVAYCFEIVNRAVKRWKKKRRLCGYVHIA